MGYAEETEYASTNLIRLMSHEEEELAGLGAALFAEEQKAALHRWDFQTSDFNDDFSEAHVQGAFARMAKAQHTAGELAEQIDILRTSIGSRQLAVQAICGALLQIAKQGLSIVHGDLAASPPGRELSGISVRDIVWQARNQALHFEDGIFSKPVTDLFAKLENAFGEDFSLAKHPHSNLAKKVVHLLNWTNEDNYRADAKALGL